METDRATDLRVKVTAPDGEVFEIEANKESEIKDAKLWWPNGLGAQYLYSFTF